MNGPIIRRHAIMDANTETVAVCIKRIFIYFILSWIHLKTIKNTDGDNFVFLKFPLPCVYTWCVYEHVCALRSVSRHRCGDQRTTSPSLCFPPLHIPG